MSLRIGQSHGWMAHVSTISKGVAIVLPAFLLGLAQIPSIMRNYMAFLALCNVSCELLIVSGDYLVVLTFI
jgi:hypothetical protein